MLIIQKFGGSSLANAERIRNAAAAIAACANAGNGVVAVLSAQGGSTDELIAKAGEISASPPKRELDVLLSTGELGSVALMSMQLESMGIAAISLSGRQAGIRTDSVYGDARIEDIETTRLKAELDAGKVVTVAGFQGINSSDDITTLGRGGSDTTAVALAADLNAERCEIYTDVDGIYTADPRLIREAKRLDRIDYMSMLRLSRAGSQVLHDRSVETAMLRRVRVRLLSSLSRSGGTEVGEECDDVPFCGITRDAGQNKITLVGKAVSYDTLSEMLCVLADSGISAVPAVFCAGEAAVYTAEEDVLPALKILHHRFFE